MKNISIDRRIGNLLKKFIEVTEETFRDSMIQCLVDYVNILSHVKGNNPNLSLVHLVYNFEMDAQVIFKKMSQSRGEYLRFRKEESILLDKKLPICDNQKYDVISIPDELYNGIEVLLKREPHMFSHKKAATIKDIANRSVLFRVIENDNLINSDIYRAWRLQQIIKKEKQAKINFEEALQVVSKKRRVVWDE